MNFDKEGAMTKLVCCEWCLEPLKVKDTFNPRKKKVVCSRGCHDAETLFNMMFSDEEINRKRHYDELTKGED